MTDDPRFSAAGGGLPPAPGSRGAEPESGREKKRRRKRPRKGKGRGLWFFGSAFKKKASRRKASRPPEEEPEGTSEKRRARRPRPRRSQLSWKVVCCLVAVCALAALLFVAVQRITFIEVANFILFGTSDPYVSPERSQAMRKEFEGIIQKEMGAKKLK